MYFSLWFLLWLPSQAPSQDNLDVADWGTSKSAGKAAKIKCRFVHQSHNIFVVLHPHTQFSPRTLLTPHHTQRLWLRHRQHPVHAHPPPPPQHLLVRCRRELPRCVQVGKGENRIPQTIGSTPQTINHGPKTTDNKPQTYNQKRKPLIFNFSDHRCCRQGPKRCIGCVRRSHTRVQLTHARAHALPHT